MNTKSKSAFLKPFIAAMVLTTGSFINNEASAQTVKEQSAIEAKPALLVNFAGEEKGYLVFNVNLQQNINRRFTLRISDQDKNELFNESLVQNSYSKRILIPAADVEKISFTLYTLKSEIRKTFEINYEANASYVIKDMTEK